MPEPKEETPEARNERIFKALVAKFEEKGAAVTLPGKMGPDGVWVITWTTDDDTLRLDHAPATNVKSMMNHGEDYDVRQAAIKAIEKAFDEAEGLANVRFVRAAHVDRKANADLRFYFGEMYEKVGEVRKDANGRDVEIKAEVLGHAAGSWSTGPREIVVKRGYKPEDFDYGKEGFAVVVHEIGHALGLPHAGKVTKEQPLGHDPKITTYDTIMAPPEGDLPKSWTHLDAEALQWMFGASKKPARERVTAAELTKTATLHSTKPVTIDLRDTAPGGAIGQLAVDLSAPDGTQSLGGYLYSAHDRASVNMRMTKGTQVKDVLVASNTEIGLHVTGNALPNRFTGGMQTDYLHAHGGKDTLTGNGGQDNFVLDEKSGRGNTITDFTASDLLQIGEMSRVRLTRPAGNTTDILLEMIDKNGKTVADATLLNAHSADVLNGMRLSRTTKLVNDLPVTGHMAFGDLQAAVLHSDYARTEAIIQKNPELLKRADSRALSNLMEMPIHNDDARMGKILADGLGPPSRWTRRDDHGEGFSAHGALVMAVALNRQEFATMMLEHGVRATPYQEISGEWSPPAWMVAHPQVLQPAQPAVTPLSVIAFLNQNKPLMDTLRKAEGKLGVPITYTPLPEYVEMALARYDFAMADEFLKNPRGPKLNELKGLNDIITQAIDKKQHVMLEYLFSHGVEARTPLTLPDNRISTALQFAMEKKDAKAVQIIQNHMPIAAEFTPERKDHGLPEEVQLKAAPGQSIPQP